MPVESFPLRSWLKPTAPPKTNRRPLQCEQLEDRLTPSGTVLSPGVTPYLPPSQFVIGAADTATSTAAPLAIAFGYLDAHAAEFGISAGDLAQAFPHAEADPVADGGFNGARQAHLAAHPRHAIPNTEERIHDGAVEVKAEEGHGVQVVRCDV